MKNIKMGFIKRAVVFILTIVCSCSTVFSASAANTATHSFGPGMNQHVGRLPFTNDNWTPVKTICGTTNARRFYFNGYFKKADSYSGLVQHL